MSARSLESLEQILNAGGDADDVLRAVVHALVADPAVAWAGIAFLDDGELTLGPEDGVRGKAAPERFPIEYEGERVGELRVEGDVDRTLLESLAASIAPHVLVGWDTRGEVWEP